MKKYILGCLFFVTSILSYSQTNNPSSLYEGLIVQSVAFKFQNPPADTSMVEAYRKIIASEFAVPLQSQYSAIMASFYTSKLNLLPFVSEAKLNVAPTMENQVALTVDILLSDKDQIRKSETIVKNPRLLPVLYNSERTYLTAKIAASEMVYTNDNTWFAQPTPMTSGNPLADHPSGKGWSGWLEGFGSVGVYGVYKLIPSINLHLYGGASYLVSFSAGDELFTQKARIYGAVEDAFVGVVGGKQTARGDIYRYNFTYGRKSFTLGDGWLIINTAMNGYNRAALQLNPRWAARQLITGGLTWNRFMVQGFSVNPNELDILNSKTTINGVNLEMNNGKYGLLALSYLTVPHSKFRYYLPDGTVQSRAGLEVYNVRLFRTTGQEGGLFFKGEAGYQRNRHFDMNAWAYYGELGWNFAKVKGSPAISYRFAHFDGDDSDSKSYNRWDALYTGGNGEQWVQGSIMYKLVQNSNENTHRLQAVYRPASKLQMVGQIWLFYAPQLNNIGGNPALSTLKSKFYGTEYNLTLKYFPSRQWYFHLNAAYAQPGGAIKDNVADTKNWFSAMAFARYTF